MAALFIVTSPLVLDFVGVPASLVVCALDIRHPQTFNTTEGMAMV